MSEFGFACAAILDIEETISMAGPTASRSDIIGIARDANTFFFPMLMGYRYLFGSFLVPELPSHMRPLNTCHDRDWPL